MHRQHILFGVVAALATAWMNHASAQLMFSSSFGNAPTYAAFGVFDGKVGVVEINLNTNACATRTFSSNTSLTQQVNFFLGNGNHRARVITPDWPASICGKNVTAYTGSKKIFVLGGSGQDIIIGGPSSAVGGGGGDDALVLLGAAPSGGDGGNDWIIQYGSDGDTQMAGGDGNDVLCDFHDGSGMWGGPGTDSTWNAIARSSMDNEKQANPDDCSWVAFSVLAGSPF